MTSHDQTLALAAERHTAVELDRDAAPGAAVKFAACYCDDGSHGYPDRVGWVATADVADEDLAATSPSTGHLVIRFTAVLDDARDALIDALAASDGLTGTDRVLRRALYRSTADRLIDALGGVR